MKTLLNFHTHESTMQRVSTAIGTRPEDQASEKPLTPRSRATRSMYSDRGNATRIPLRLASDAFGVTSILLSTRAKSAGSPAV